MSPVPFCGHAAKIHIGLKSFTQNVSLCSHITYANALHNFGRAFRLDQTERFIILHIEEEMNYISVLHNIFLALGAYLTLLLCGGK